MTLSVLYIGGTGTISLPCVERSVAAGHKVAVLNRGLRGGLPDGVEQITGDWQDDTVYAGLAARNFDVICQFLCFTPAQMRREIAAFAGRTRQYVFISSASAYAKPDTSVPITENTALHNPDWQYSRDKADCERLLAASALRHTIVRPSHTMRTRLPYPLADGATLLARMKARKPILIPGDGTSFWTLTRAQDFAVPFVRLLGNPLALGEAFHITGKVGFTWNHIVRTIGAGIEVKPDLVHVASAMLARHHPDWHGTLLGDKSHSAVFDTSKLSRIVGEFACETDLARILADPIRHTLADPTPPDARIDAVIDAAIELWG